MKPCPSIVETAGRVAETDCLPDVFPALGQCEKKTGFIPSLYLRLAYILI
jgi:hypothetical protein